MKRQYPQKTRIPEAVGMTARSRCSREGAASSVAAGWVAPTAAGLTLGLRRDGGIKQEGAILKCGRLWSEKGGSWGNGSREPPDAADAEVQREREA